MQIQGNLLDKKLSNFEDFEEICLFQDISSMGTYFNVASLEGISFLMWHCLMESAFMRHCFFKRSGVAAL